MGSEMTKKYPRYQDYVIKNGVLVGEFDEMYRDFEDPWGQSTEEEFSSDKAVCLNLVKSMRFQNIVEIGCGLGHFSNRLNLICDSVTGLDISSVAVKKAALSYPSCCFEVSEFPDLERLRLLKPDCIVMAEVTWYVLEHLDDFIEFLRNELPDTYLIHMLMTYPLGEQKYGADKFTNLAEIKSYFGMNYHESGLVQNHRHNGGSRTYFMGRFAGLN